MTDESPRDARPVPAPLQREVEAPRTATGLWLPFMALASAAMLTIVSGIAVMSRPARPVMIAPATVVELPAVTAKQVNEIEALKRDVDALIREQKAFDEELRRSREGNLEEVRFPCGGAVHRGDLDGRPQPFEECITYRRKAK